MQARKQILIATMIAQGVCTSSSAATAQLLIMKPTTCLSIHVMIGSSKLASVLSSGSPRPVTA